MEETTEDRAGRKYGEIKASSSLEDGEWWTQDRKTGKELKHSRNLYYRLFLTTVRSHQGRAEKTRKGEGGNWGKLKGKERLSNLPSQDKGR